jgi:hypothetical protein
MTPDVRSAPVAPVSPEDADWARRKQQLLAASGIIAVLAVIAAAVFWYAGSGGGTPQTAPLPPLAVSAGDHALVLGPASAPHTVVVHEEFGDAASRRWDQATRDFLKADARAGLVRVEYRPVARSTTGYGADAAIAFGTVLTADPKRGAAQALALHGVLFDHGADSARPTPEDLARWAGSTGASAVAVQRALDAHDVTWLRAANAQAARAGVRRLPVVLLDGRPLSGATLVDRADALERALARF